MTELHRINLQHLLLSPALLRVYNCPSSLTLPTVYWSSHSLPSVAVLVPSVSVSVPVAVASSLVSLSPSEVPDTEDSVTDSGTGPNDLIVVGAVVSDYSLALLTLDRKRLTPPIAESIRLRCLSTGILLMEPISTCSHSSLLLASSRASASSLALKVCLVFSARRASSDIGFAWSEIRAFFGLFDRAR
jgi:hypothetical protein